MASAGDRPEFTDEEIADLTDAELVGLRRFALAEFERLIPDLGPSAELVHSLPEGVRRTYLLAEFERRGLSGPTAELEARFLTCIGLQGRVEREMGRRMGEMLRGARLALGLTFREVARVGGTHSKFVDETERGLRGSSGPDLFERACTEGGLEGAGDRWRRSIWFPILDARICRTIREVAVDPSWLTRNGGAAADLARSIFRDHSIDFLPILGDALEEAGCDDLAILGHCRAPGQHARGCWVVDALVRASRPS